MPEATQLMFNPQEVVTALLKQQGIHEGIWMISVTFGFSATTLAQGAPGGTEEAFPAAIVPVTAIGIRRAEALNNLAVDAAVANPIAGASEPATRLTAPGGEGPKPTVSRGLRRGVGTSNSKS